MKKKAAVSEVDLEAFKVVEGPYLLDAESFDGIVRRKTGRWFAVFFTVPWAFACNQANSAVHELAEKQHSAPKSDFFVGKLNVERYENLGKELSITRVPTMVFFYEGKEYGRIEGGSFSIPAMRRAFKAAVETKQGSEKAPQPEA